VLEPWFRCTCTARLLLAVQLFARPMAVHIIAPFFFLTFVSDLGRSRERSAYFLWLPLDRSRYVCTDPLRLIFGGAP